MKKNLTGLSLTYLCEVHISFEDNEKSNLTSLTKYREVHKIVKKMCKIQKGANVYNFERKEVKLFKNINYLNFTSPGIESRQYNVLSLR